MFIDAYYSEDGTGFSFTRQQASAFAKAVADDFNPLHDEHAKLFCVPGDLLFALTLTKIGLNQQMCFTFSGMVSDQVSLKITDTDQLRRAIVDDNGKEYLTIDSGGEVSHDQQLIEEFSRSYVEFSGHNFEHILVPLMEQHGVMLNPQRPLVMYQNMSVELDRLDLSDITLELDGAVLEVNGKKGDVRMDFILKSGSEVVGRGVKRMAVRGLQPYNQVSVEEMIAAYGSYKEAFASAD